MQLSVVIPCFNEIENVPRLKTELIPVLVGMADRREVELVIVDDGSTDGTLNCLRETFKGGGPVAIQISRHAANQGLGAALRTGFRAAQGGILVTTDCDGTFDFSLIPELVSLMTPEIDIVTASPHHPRGTTTGVPAHRRLLSIGCSMIYRLLVTRKLHSYTSLLRAYRREVVTNISYESDGYLAGTELLVRALLSGYHAAEFPVRLTARRSGVSKIDLGRTILAHLRFQLRILIHRWPIKRSRFDL